MRSSPLVIARVFVAGFGLAVLADCQPTTGPTGTDGAVVVDGAVSPALHAEPPAPGPVHPGDGTGSVTLAISKLYFGDTDPDGTMDKANGWKNYGYDIDGKISMAASTDLCKPRNNASPSTVYPDGNDGIDNSFGKLILPILLGIASDLPARVNANIAGGKLTVLFDMQKLGAGTDENPLVTNLFNGGNLAAAPKFDGTDPWPVLSSSLLDGMTLAGGAKVSFPASYVTAGTWVSGSAGTASLSLPLGNAFLDLTIAGVVISMQLSADHKTATRGVLSGVLDTAQFTARIQALAGSFDPMLCNSLTLQSIVDQVTEASDILHDGTQDPTQPCDGISIGLGFDAAAVQLGPVAPPPALQPNPCATTDGGA